MISLIKKSYKTWIWVNGLLLLMLSSACADKNEDANKEDERRPNIVLILTDDQAYGDLSFMDNPISETPNLDLLAKNGAFFDHFYVSPVCAPTRASLLTGRYHQRTGVTGVTRGRENMSLEEETLADILKANGYATGIFGKWHNGAHYPFHPMGRGFDEFVGFTSGHWSSYFDTTIEKNGKPFFAEGYLPDVLTDEALAFIKKNNAAHTPFFCFVPYQTPHTPLQVPDKYFDKFKEKGADDFNATMYGMAENIDDNIGRILTTLEELAIEEETIIIYLSDNGPLNLRYNKGLKGRKGQVDEGGVRVPFILNWKNHIQSETRNAYPLAHIDVLPTLMSLLGIAHTPKNELDGVNFEALLKDKGQLPTRDLFMEWGGNRRLLSNGYLMINDQLYNLQEDPGQKNDIKKQNPKVYDSMNLSYEKWIQNFPQEENPKVIPLGYKDYPLTSLPAHEANLFPPFEFRKDRRHTGIAYHSLHGWAHDWIDDWTKQEAYATWSLNNIEQGSYEVEISYALAKEDVGAKILIDIGGQQLKVNQLEAFEHSPKESHDRIPREQEAPDTDWKKVKVGEVEIPAGPVELKVMTTAIPGTKSIELKGIDLIRIK